MEDPYERASLEPVARTGRRDPEARNQKDAARAKGPVDLSAGVCPGGAVMDPRRPEPEAWPCLRSGPGQPHFRRHVSVLLSAPGDLLRMRGRVHEPLPR